MGGGQIRCIVGDVYAACGKLDFRCLTVFSQNLKAELLDFH